MLTLPSDWQSASASGVKSILGGPWTSTAIAAGTAAHYRLKDSTATTTDNTGTTHEQGNITMPVSINTNGVTAANSNVLNFAATTGVVAGMNISGTGIVAGSTVLATTGTTVTMSMASTAGVSSAASITFAGDLYLDNTNIAINQTVSVSAWTKTEPNA